MRGEFFRPALSCEFPHLQKEREAERYADSQGANYGSPQLAHTKALPFISYEAEQHDHGHVSAYAIEATTGALTPVPGSPFSAGAGRNEVTVDPSGQFVYVVNGAGNVSAYTIDPGSGALTSIPGWPFPAGSGSSGVTVDPRVASSTLPIKRPLTFPRTPLTPLPAPWPQGPVRRFRRD